MSSVIICLYSGNMGLLKGIYNLILYKMSFNTPWNSPEAPKPVSNSDEVWEFSPSKIPNEIREDEALWNIQDWIEQSRFYIYMNDVSPESFEELKSSILPEQITELFQQYDIIDNTYVMYTDDPRYWNMELRIWENTNVQDIGKQLIVWLLNWFAQWNFNPLDDNWALVHKIEDFYWVHWDEIREDY